MIQRMVDDNGILVDLDTETGEVTEVVEYENPFLTQAKEQAAAEGLPGTAMVKVNPLTVPSILSMSEEASKVYMYALQMVVDSQPSEKDAIDNRAICKTMIEAGEKEQKQWLAPLKEYMESIKADFNHVLKPLRDADAELKAMILAYRNKLLADQRIKDQQAERDAEAARIKGEPDPVVKQDFVPPKTVRAGLASSSDRMGKKWRRKEGLSEAEVIAGIPAKFLMLNETLIGQMVRGKTPVTEADFGGVIELYEELNITNTRRRGE